MEITLLKRILTHPPQVKREPLLIRIMTWTERHRQRTALLRLDDRMLSDIGISRCEAEAEASKPFWVE
ncbi:MAG: DUF1127 domain-containing protein [Sedimenticola sp.]|nr:DUF1127 domain-containing protein [Sedimenticola sp.]